MIKLSIIIPARNEFPNVAFTCHDIWNCWEADGFDPKELEIIIIDNCSTDDKYPQRGTGGTSSYMFGRGAYFNRALQIIYDPIAGNHSARNKGALVARGEYLFFSDAHMSYKPGFFKSILETTKESGGLVHGTLQFMGAYPPTDSGSGFGYTIKLGDEIKGTWNNYKISDTWFYVPAQGHWGLCVKKSQFMEFGGYPKIHRTYGGGEFYTDIKWWMFGSTVVVDPHAIGYHLASGRGYSYNHDDYIENVLGMAWALGADEWRERAYLNWMRTGNKKTMDSIYERSQGEHQKDREFVKKKAVMSFNELLIERPWKKLNEKRHGKGMDNLLIYQNTWIDLMRKSPQYVQDIYDSSEKQKSLAEFIDKNLSQFVYKR